MGNQYRKFFTSPSKHQPDSSPSLLSYKQRKSLPMNYPGLTPKKSIESTLTPIQLVKKEPLNRLSQYHKPSIIENYIIVWLTSNIDKNQNSINYLQGIFNSFRLFTDINEFFAFILKIKDEKLFLILSDTLAEKYISFIHKISPLIAIYIISKDISKDEQWIKQYRKIKGIFTNIEPICKKLRYEIHLSENNIIPIEILNSSTIIIQYLITQILLYETDYHEKSKRDFINFARQQYPNELNIINEFEENYTPSQAIWWYTRKCFVYFSMHKAFRTQSITLLIKMGFLIRDLHQQINRSYEEIDKANITIVYRGQGISENELEIIKTNKNGLLSFKNFLWTNTNPNISLRFAQSARNTCDLYGALFRIEIHSSTTFMSLETLGYYLNSSSEILLSVDSIFHIGEIKQIEDKIWQIDLTLMKHSNQKLKEYLQCLQDIEGETAWQQLGFYFIQINQYDKAEELYKTLIGSNSINDPKKLSLLNEQLAFIYHKKDDPINSLLYYKKSLKNYLIFLPQNHSSLLRIYLNMGILLRQQNNSNEAIKHFKCALNIALHSSSIDHLQIAILYHHIAEINRDNGIFVDAIQNYQSALESELNHFPLHHLSIAKTYNEIGDIFYRMDDYATAFSYFDKTIQIQKKSLSPNHSILAITNYNLARASNGLQQYKEAIEYASRAVNIARHSFGSHHEDVRLYESYLDELREKTLIGVIPNGAVYE